MKNHTDLKHFIGSNSGGTAAHVGTIDVETYGDHYEITAIEPATKKVLVNFSYKKHALHHHFFVENVADKVEIVEKAEAEYNNYKAQIEERIANHPDIPQAVHDLLGQKQKK